MTDTARWTLMKDLFDQALDLDPQKRSAFVKEQCGDDQDVFDEVMSLLRSDENTHSLLDAPAVAALDPFEDSALIGSRIGVYRIKSKIASGGMGAVYLAERADDQFTQQVALKLIKLGMDSEEVIRRFQSERQFLANLEHPSIARLLDGGVTDNGRLYFAMEYVDGSPLIDYCDEKKLSIKERLSIFAMVCGAVQYAHQNLIVHRDIKPGNILVDSDGAPKLLDFGIAKTLDDGQGDETQITQTGYRAMTPAYASPEQILGQPVTTASDVFSLGVTLYELLTGQRPYDLENKSPAQIERELSTSQKRTPSQAVARLSRTKDTTGRARQLASLRGLDEYKLRKLLRGDLDTICLMALQTDPARRYSTAGQLKEDIERYLRRDPVIARRDTTAYRVSKFVSRHRVSVTLLTIFLGALFGLTAVYTNRLAHERNLAELEAAKATQVADFVEGLFNAADPNLAQGEEITARELLEQGRERVDIELEGQAELQAAMLRVIGRSYGQLGLLEKAKVTLQEALDHHRNAFETRHEKICDALRDLGFVYYELGEMDSALSCYNEALRLDLENFGELNVETQADLNNIGSTLRKMGSFDTAIVVLKRALVVGRQIPGIDSLDLAHSMNQLGRLLAQEGRTDEAEPYLIEGLKIRTAAWGEDHFEVCASRGTLAGMYSDMGKLDQARQLYRANLITLEKLVGSDHHYVGGTLGSMASVERKDKQYDLADSLYRLSYKVLKATLPEGHGNLAAPLVGHGMLMTETGRAGEAVPMLRRAVKLRANQLGERHWRTLQAEIALGAALLRSGAATEARRLLERVSDKVESEYGQDHKLSQRTYRLLQEIYILPGDSLKARENNSRISG